MNTDTKKEECKWEEISSAKFIWEKYIGKVGYATSQIFKDFETLDYDIEPLGYCKAVNLSIRPRYEGYAIMVAIDGEECWMHCLALPIYKTQSQK